MIKILSKIKKFFRKAYYKVSYAYDRTVIDLNLIPIDGATETLFGVKTIKTQMAGAHFFIDSKVDAIRDIEITFIFRNGGHGARTTDGALYLAKVKVDGSYDVSLIESYTSFDAVFSANFGSYKKTYTLLAEDITKDYSYTIGWRNDETDYEGATQCWVSCIQVKYYKSCYA